MSLSRLRPSPAMAVALAALVVAMGGTAVAGDLINGADIKKDTVTGKQVKESSLAKVPKASSADKLTPLPAGQLMHGVFAAGASSSTADGYLGVGITYARPLTAPILNDHVVGIQGDAFTTECPGPGKAKAGFLCLYNRDYSSVGVGYGYADEPYLKVDGRSIGATVYWNITGPQPYVGGSWTLRAPTG